MIEWHHIDGSTTVVDDNTTDGQLLRVLQEALRSLRGEYPSINSPTVIDEILDEMES